jgi:hypothetical protein
LQFPDSIHHNGKTIECQLPSPATTAHQAIILLHHTPTDLTENRIQTPWIDALREKERGGHDPTKPSGKSETPNDRDLSPKRMSDSYHSVVLPLAREPWLLDTYANSSGHIRLGTLFMDLDALSTPLREARPRSLD